MMLEDRATEVRGTTTFLSQSIISGVFRVVNIMILTRLLLQQEMGQIAVLGIIYGVMQFLGAVGLNYASPLVVPEEEFHGRLDRVKGFLRRSVSLILTSSAILILLVVGIAPYLISSTILSSQLILLVALICPFSALEAFLDSFLLARYQVRHLAAGRILFDITRVLATVSLVIMGFGIIGVVVGWLLGELAAVFVFGLAATRPLKVKSSPIDMRPVLAFALPSLLFQTVDVTIQNTDRIILLVITDLSSLGVYDVLLGILFMMSFVSLAVSTALYPVLTKLRLNHTAEGDLRGFGDAVGMLLRYIIMLLLPVAIIAALNAHIIIQVLFGASYANFPNASLAFSLLLLSYAVWGIVYALHTVLRSMGESRFFLLAGLGIIVFEIMACWYLTSLYGLLGSAITRSLYIMLLLILSLARIRQHGIRGIGRVSVSVAKIGFASVISGVFVWWIAPVSFLSLVIWLGASLGIYVALLFLIHEVNPLDFQVARHLLPLRLQGLANWIERKYL
ncbi:MAG: oligosaccharide flippase family protein [Candidatus Thorarchaeota archaeon]|nr:oligosaccharide flippase family protein [Candidatus Thorarchaeota archaeon]